jgi:hypothetical protein
MSLAANLAKLGKLLLAQASGVINGPTPNAGDNSQAVINSAWFKAEQATETAQGTAKVATQAVTNAGTDDTTIVTPKKLRAGFAISLSGNGYIAFPSWMSGLIVQWGQAVTNASGVASSTLPIVFPAAQLIGFGTVQNGSAITGIVTLQGLTLTSVTLDVLNNSGAAISGATVNWLALGR